MSQILFTGFEAFGNHSFNPSAVAAEEAASAAGAAFELLAVDFETARAAGAASADYDLVIHVGLAAATGWVRLERFAHNIRMERDDPSQEHDPDNVVALDSGGPLALQTVYSVGPLRKALSDRWDARHSRDAGTYVCNATYYWSLRLAPQTTSIFIHVPAWEEDVAGQFGRHLGTIARGQHT